MKYVYDIVDNAIDDFKTFSDSIAYYATYSLGYSIRDTGATVVIKDTDDDNYIKYIKFNSIKNIKEEIKGIKIISDKRYLGYKYIPETYKRCFCYKYIPETDKETNRYVLLQNTIVSKDNNGVLQYLAPLSDEINIKLSRYCKRVSNNVILYHNVNDLYGTIILDGKVHFEGYSFFDKETFYDFDIRRLSDNKVKYYYRHIPLNLIIDKEDRYLKLAPYALTTSHHYGKKFETPIENYDYGKEKVQRIINFLEKVKINPIENKYFYTKLTDYLYKFSISDDENLHLGILKCFLYSFLKRVCLTRINEKEVASPLVLLVFNYLETNTIEPEYLIKFKTFITNILNSIQDKLYYSIIDRKTCELKLYTENEIKYKLKCELTYSHDLICNKLFNKNRYILLRDININFNNGIITRLGFKYFTSLNNKFLKYYLKVRLSDFGNNWGIASLLPDIHTEVVFDDSINKDTCNINHTWLVVIDRSRKEIPDIAINIQELTDNRTIYKFMCYCFNSFIKVNNKKIRNIMLLEREGFDNEIY